jgi:hypothetical protein
MSNDIESSDQQVAADLLRGGPRIARKLQELGWGNGEPDVAYYAYKVGSWPIGKIGKNLVASDARLTRHAKKMTAA